MAKTIYEGLRVGKNGGERWSGTINRDSRSGRFVDSKPATARKLPKGGSALSKPSKISKNKG